MNYGVNLGGLSGYRIMAVLALIVVLGGLAVFGVQQYAGKRVAQASTETVEKVVSEAVAERREATRVDTIQTKERSASVDAVRAVVRSARKETNAIQAEAGCAVVDDAEHVRVLNRTISELNERISAAAILHD